MIDVSIENVVQGSFILFMGCIVAFLSKPMAVLSNEFYQKAFNNKCNQTYLRYGFFLTGISFILVALLIMIG